MISLLRSGAGGRRWLWGVLSSLFMNCEKTMKRGSRGTFNPGSKYILLPVALFYPSRLFFGELSHFGGIIRRVIRHLLEWHSAWWSSKHQWKMLENKKIADYFFLQSWLDYSRQSAELVVSSFMYSRDYFLSVSPRRSLLYTSRCTLPSVQWYGWKVDPTWDCSQQHLWIILSNWVAISGKRPRCCSFWMYILGLYEPHKPRAIYY